MLGSMQHSAVLADGSLSTPLQDYQVAGFIGLALAITLLAVIAVGVWRR